MAWKRTSFQNYCNSIVGYDGVWYGRVWQAVEDYEDQQGGYGMRGHVMATMVGMVEYERVWRTMRTSTSRQGDCPVASFTRAGYLQLRQAPSTKHQAWDKFQPRLATRSSTTAILISDGRGRFSLFLSGAMSYYLCRAQSESVIVAKKMEKCDIKFLQGI